MAHCHDEHDHGHGGHGGGGGHGAHDHSDDIKPALQSLLYEVIEFDKVSTLNESNVDAGKKMLQKTWAQRLDEQPSLSSDADEQLLITIPFAGTVKLHSLLIRGSNSATSPRTVKLFINQEGLDFGAVSDQRPVQTLELSRTSEVQDVPVRRALFNNTYSLTIFVESNHSDGDEDVTDIFYLGFKGEFTRLHRDAIEVMYEAAANPNDHALIQGIGDRGTQGLGRGM